MASLLTGLKAIEVSLVPQGANKQEFLIVKEDEGMAEPTAFEKALKDAGLDAALTDKVLKSLEPMMKGLSDKGKNAVQAALKILTAVKDEVPEDLIRQLMAVAGMGNPTPPPAPAVPAAPVAMGAPIMKEDGSYDFSGVPEAVRPVVEAVYKEKATTDRQLAKVQKELDDARDARVTKEFQEKAAGFKHLGVKTEDLASVMKEINTKAPEAFGKLEPILKALDEKVAKSGLLGEVGSNAGGQSVTPVAGQTEAEAKIEAIAKGYVEKDGKLTKSAAIAKAWNDNPALYAQHRTESDARKRA